MTEDAEHCSQDVIPSERSESRKPQCSPGRAPHSRSSFLAIHDVKAVEGPAERSVRRAPRLRGLRVKLLLLL